MVMVTARFVGAQAQTGVFFPILAKDVTVKESAQSVVAQARTKLLTLQIKL